MNENTEKRTKKNTKLLKMGTYSTFLTIIAIVAAIVVNLLFAQLPANITKLDTSSNALYTISDETKELVKNIKDKVTFYLIAETGGEDETILEVLEKYKALNSNISIQKVDPILRPSFTSNYTDDETELVSNSVIVESEKRYSVISYYDIYVTTYSEQDYLNYYQYGITPTGTQTFAAENEFTSALDYVTTDLLPTLYALQGHGESALSASVKGYIDMENIELKDLSLLSLEAVPADTTGILINVPTMDISANEYEMLLTYAKAGGKIMLLTDPTSYTEAKMPNLAKLAAHFGVMADEGIIREGNSNKHYPGYKSVLIPTVTADSLSENLSTTNFNTLLYNAHGIIKTNTAGVGTITPLLTTSDAAYIKKNDSETTEKESGDSEGPFYVAVTVDASNSGASLFWVSSGNFLNENYDYLVSYGNTNLFMGAVTKLCEKSSSISIIAKSMNVTALSITEGIANILGIIFILVIPVACAAFGLVIWTKRRKR